MSLLVCVILISFISNMNISKHIFLILDLVMAFFAALKGTQSIPEAFQFCKILLKMWILGLDTVFQLTVELHYLEIRINWEVKTT